ncbi:MAG: histidinol dehydrogenase, partial [Planktomarina sp.]|nr:histidinol dehydrogenase [Planktomarina sp.]
MAILKWGSAIADEKSKALARPEGASAEDFQTTISSIFKAVVSMGDKALLDLTDRFDKVKLDALSLNLNDIDTPSITKTDKEAIQQAAKNIRAFHQAQLPKPIKVETMVGVFCEKQWRPIETVGLYVPGGSAPLVSTLLMLVIPAQIAGVKNIVLCTPPQKGNDAINPHILWTAKWLGIET